MNQCKTHPAAPSVADRERAREKLPLANNDGQVRKLGMPIRMLRLAQVIEATGLGKTKIYELQAEGSFPMRVKITSHSVAWVEAEVQAWLAQRIAASTVLDNAPAPSRSCNGVGG